MAQGHHLAASQCGRINRRHIVAGSLLLALAMPFSQASATPIHMMQSETILLAAITAQLKSCPVSGSSAFGNTAVAGAPEMSKASAILGGQGSALERMRLQQSGAAPAPFAATPTPSSGPNMVGVTPPLAGTTNCNMATNAVATMPPLRTFAPIAIPAAAPTRQRINFLESRLEVRKTPFDSQWRRVTTASRQAAITHAARSGAHGVTRASVQTINSYVNRHVRYVDDRVLYKKADHWASASETLRRGAGDCEDYAIAKMQLLKRAGFAPDQMQLSVVRDLARNADHAILLVTVGNETVILDNMTDTLTNAESAQDYRPIMSFSANKKWLHGFSTAALDNRR